MEKQEREHQECSAEVTVKHSKELEDLGKNMTGPVSAQSRDDVSVLLQGLVCLSVIHRVILQPEADRGA